ncbi:hypothetical protein AB0H34_03065 [Saccharopolyspora shandongensis]|uniref:hypothetical protein n=1 Tax=Saccharopolyspora shandongensis TaxID=418495 RepID=UPI0033E6E234
MTNSQHQPYLGARLNLVALRGEVTVIAEQLVEQPACTPREMAVCWITSAMEEAAAVLRGSLNLTREERVQLVEDIESAAEALFRIEFD